MHLCIPYLNKEVNEIFSHGPMVSFRGARKLESYLVRVKLYLLEMSVGFFKCNGKQCHVCLGVTETKKLLRKSIKFNSNVECLIYLLTCNKYMFQYVGKTVDKFRLKWDNYKMNNRNFLKGQICIQQRLFENSASEGHCSFLENVTATFIDKTDPKDPNRREHYWRHALKTMAPLGLNVQDDQVISEIF